MSELTRVSSDPSFTVPLSESEITLRADDLPAKLLSFDIETSHTSFRRPDKSTLAVAGALEFRLIKSKLIYRRAKYRFFLTDQMQELSDFLNSFDGIILGHNLLNFDYRVLERHIDLKAVIPKTVDTLAFIYNIYSNKRGGVSLDNLAHANLGKGKTIAGKNISDMWNSGKREEVIQYNKNDCVLTKEIWWHMVRNGSITTSHRFFGRDKVFLEAEDYSYLLGMKPHLDYLKWMAHIDEHGNGIYKKREIWVARIADAGISPDEKAIFHHLLCSFCGHEFLLATPIDYYLAENTLLNCPQCQKVVDAIEAYRGTVYESVTTFASIKCRLPGNFDRRAAITTDKAIKLARRRRTWRPW